MDSKTIFIRLMDRLAAFALESDTTVENLNKEIDIYGMFKNNIDNIVEKTSNVEFKNVLDLMVAFLNFTLKCYDG